MQTRTITIQLDLPDSTAKIFDEALYSYDDYFMNELQDRISDFLTSNTEYVRRTVEDIAYTLVEDFNEQEAV